MRAAYTAPSSPRMAASCPVACLCLETDERASTLTQQDDSRAVVATGLQAGEQVVTTGFARLTEGAQVAVSDAENAGQIAPAGQSRPDGARGKRGSEKGKGSPSAGLPRTANP